MGTAAATPGGATRRPRADAERNRQRIVAAALDVLLEHGPDAPLDEIARRAGVGNATVYRHFPDRPALIRNVLIAVMDETAGFAEEALAEEPDAAQALRRFVHQAAASRLGATAAALKPWFDKDAPDYVAAREHLNSAVQALVERGQDSGGLRPDIAVSDVIVILSQLTRPLPGTDCPLTDRFVHRFLDVLLDGLCTPNPSPLSGEPISFEALRLRCEPGGDEA
jgi:AcrR family transcriptional regulator